MMVDSGTRFQLRIQSGLFIILFVASLGVLAWLSQLNPVVIDFTVNQRNSLSAETIRLIDALEEPIEVTAFVSPLNEKRKLIQRLFQRYQQQQPLIQFQILNPDLNPGLLREHNIRLDGETVIVYQGRSEKVDRISETNITSSIQRLMREGERWLVFLQGHGERNPYDESNFGLSLFATQLASKGYRVENLTLTQSNAIPENTDVLVLASPRVPLLPGEIDLIQDHLAQGGNLLWLADPDQVIDSLESIADMLAIEFLPGIIVDPNSQLLGLDRVDFALVNSYPRHPVTEALDSIAIFPQAQALDYHGEAGIWEQSSILLSGDSSWNETGQMAGEIFNGDNDDEISGPLSIGFSLAAGYQDDEETKSEQRIIVVGDADFLSNRYLGNGGNLDLGVNIVNWLSLDDKLISISPRAAPDTRLELSKIQQLFIGFGFLLILPVLLFGCGLTIWLKRRNR
jgi:ABC-type uncharacterized transport system involved in gliding motility auxiliary subunit